VDIYDGVRAPAGVYFLSYSSFYLADEFTGAGGKAKIADFGYRSAGEILRLCWYSPDLVLTALVPVSGAQSSYLEESAGGLGDILLAAGGFLPVRSVDLLFFLGAKAPTGDYDADEPLNPGSGQWNIRPSLFLHKTLEPYTLDAVARYNIRLKNPDTGLKPGDEFHLEFLATRKLGPVRVGPGASWMLGRDQSQSGQSIPESARQVLSLGLEAYFRLGEWAVTLNYMGDVYSVNTTRGHLFRFKLCLKL